MNRYLELIFIVFFSLSFAIGQPPVFESELEGKEPVSIRFKNTDIQDVVATLASKLGQNIIVQSEVEAKITATLDKVQPIQALDLICRTHKLNWVEEDETIIIFSRESYLAEAAYHAYNVKRVPINYRSARDIFNKITIKDESISPEALNGVGLSRFGGKVFFDNSDNSITLLDTDENIQKVKGLITNFDTRIKSVLIEAKVIDVTLSENQSIGVKWDKLFSDSIKIVNTLPTPGLQASGTLGVPLGKLSGGKFKGNMPFEAIISALATDNEVNVLSSPRITAINGEEAKLNVGSEEPYSTSVFVQDRVNPIQDWKFVPVGIILNVTPQIFGKSVQLKVRPEVSSAGDRPESGARPVVNTSDFESTIYLENGETIVLGGLIRESKSNNKSGIPGLVKVPVLGVFFSRTDKKKDKRELIVLIKVTIL